MKYLIFLLLFYPFFGMSSISTVDPSVPSLVEVEAHPGDGIISLLRRYGLEESLCNLEKFLEINRLQSSTALYRHKKYALPIYVYQYNSTSIRSTIGVDDMPLAKKIAAYNRHLVKQQILPGYYLDTRILWVPEHLLKYCVSAKRTIPTAKRHDASKPIINVKLFGEKDRGFVLESDRLKNKVYYLVSGHGGPDPGALYKTQKECLCEDEYAYDVTLRLAKNLMAQGAEVEIIIQDQNDGIRDESVLDCDYDERCLDKGTIPLNQLARLRQRTEVINEHYARRKNKKGKEHQVVVIHVDSRSKDHRQDVFFMHAKGSRQSKKLAQNLYNTFKKKYKKFRPDRPYDGEVLERNLYVLRNTHPKAVFIELANIANHRDRIRIMKQENRQALADWIFEGLSMPKAF